MSAAYSEIWEQLFGSAWKMLSDVYPKIGAFAAIKGEDLAITDRNANRLLGFDKTPGCDELMPVIAQLSETPQHISGMNLKIVRADDAVTAGYVWEYDGGTERTADQLPLLNQTQLIHRISEGGDRSLLALLEIEGTDLSSVGSYSALAAVNAILCALPDNACAAHNVGNRIWVYIPELRGDPVGTLCSLRRAVEECTVTDDDGRIRRESHSMTLSAGGCVSAANPARRMFAAGFALYQAGTEGKGAITMFSSEQYQLHRGEYNNAHLFSKLVDMNLFRYHFQPIVSAGTGEIVAYEALMRTDPSIGLNPMQILEFAAQYKRLYDVEKATMFNTIGYLSENADTFENRKLFINIISSHILSDSDFALLEEKYGNVMRGKVVIELTEQTEITDEALSTLHRRIASTRMELAVDDYGTGYSNTSNLIRYNPVYVKIDRSLISNIDTDPKKQSIVSSTIEFLHASGYMALAEGVETEAELRMMIHIGSDLIQGYYISKPKPVLMYELPENLRKEIESINLEMRTDVRKVYCPKDGEIVDIYKTVLERYTDISIDSGRVTLMGGKENSAFIGVTVKDGAEAEIVLHNVKLESDAHADSVIKLGKGSRARIICEGDNEMIHSGIYVPDGSKLRISGIGNLTICPDAFDCYGIGCGVGSSYGDITVDISGILDITANGENCVCVGGGRNENGSRIEIISGRLCLTCGSVSGLGVGSINGGAIVKMSDCSSYINISSVSAVGVGALSGSADIEMKNFSVSCKLAGNNMCCIGVLKEGTGSVTMKDGAANLNLNGKEIIGIGTAGGSLDCSASTTDLNVWAEGAVATGIGDIMGRGNVTIDDCETSIDIRSASGYPLGSPEGTLFLRKAINKIVVNDVPVEYGQENAEE